MLTRKPLVLVGLIGEAIQGSLAGELHMAEGERHGLRSLYRLIDLAAPGLSVADLPALIEAAERTGFSGLAITHPCKQVVMPLLTTLSDEARLIDAVNTVVLRVRRQEILE